MIKNLFPIGFSWYYAHTENRPFVSGFHKSTTQKLTRVKYPTGFGPRQIICKREVCTFASGPAALFHFYFPYRGLKGRFIFYATNPSSEGDGKGDGKKETFQGKISPPGQQSTPGDIDPLSFSFSSQPGKKASYSENLQMVAAQLEKVFDYQSEVKNALFQLERKVNLTNEDVSGITEITRKLLETTNFLQQLDTLEFEKSKNFPEAESVLEKIMMLTLLFVENQEKWLQQMERCLSNSRETVEILSGYATTFKSIEIKLSEASRAGELKINDLIFVFKKDLLPILESFKQNQRITNSLIQVLVGQLGGIKASSPEVENFPQVLFERENSFSQGKIEGSNIPLGEFGLTESKLAELEKTALPLLRRLRDGERLSVEENLVIQSIPLGQIALLMGRDGASDNTGLFTFPPNSVFKLILTFKDLNALQGNSIIALADTKQVLAAPKSIKMMNSLEYKEEIFFIVLANKKTLSLKQVLDFFAENIFTDGLSYMMNRLIFLEALQIQMVYPEKGNQALPQASYSLGGKLSVELFPTSPRPYVLTQSSSFGTGARNKYALRFHGVADVFFDEMNQSSPMFTMGRENVCTFLKNEISIGRNHDLVLRNCIQTRKLNSPLPFLPVADITVAGFITNANPQNSDRGLAPFNGEEGDAPKKSIT